MAISEAARHDLYTGLSEVLGPDRAGTLMNAIPLHHLDEVATKADLALLRADIKGEISAEIGDLRKSMTAWMLTILVTIVGALIGVGLLA